MKKIIVTESQLKKIIREQIEQKQTIEEALVEPLKKYYNLLPEKIFKAIKPEEKQEKEEIIKDLEKTLNDFWERHNLNRKVVSDFKQLTYEDDDYENFGD